jgi:predicted nucleic acid-binding protein
MDEEVAALQPFESDAALHDFVDQPVFRLGVAGADQRVERHECGISLGPIHRTIAPRGVHRSTNSEPCSVSALTRFVIDCDTLLRIAAGEVDVAAQHKLVAPTLVRSQALAALYESARRGELSATEGIERVTRINSLKVRFLGDKVLQRTAWRVADQLGWETTFDAEFVALTQLQADVFVTSDRELARAVSGLVETGTIDALSKA